MSQLKRNILANIAGKFWTSALQLVVIPVQVHILGMEAYGLLGFIASLQILFTLLDLGLTATITREIALDGSSRSGHTSELIQSLSFIYWAVAVAIGAALFLGADWISHRWLRFETLPESTSIATIRIVSVATALRWPIALFSGVITGLQRRDVVNVLDAGAATLRLVGGIIVLLIWRSLPAFMAWYLFSALVELCAYLITASTMTRGYSFRPRLSFTALKRVWRFALGMNGVVLFTILFTQSDRQVIAKLLSMESLGFYTVAYSVAAMLSSLPGLVTSAIFPSLSSDFGAQDHEGLGHRYNRGSQVVMMLVSLPAFALMFFGHDLLHIWISETVAMRASTVLALLASGFLLNALVTMSYITALAAGRPRYSNWINLAAIWVYLPSLYFCTNRWGGVGAAAVWVGLNVYYTISLLPLVHRTILKSSALIWAIKDVGPIMLVAAALVGAAKLISWLAFGGNLFLTGCLGVVVAVLYALFGLRRLGIGVGGVARYLAGWRPIGGA